MDEDGTSLVFTHSTDSFQGFEVLYKTKEMENPTLIYAQDQNLENVACKMSLVSTQEPPNPQDLSNDSASD